MYFIGLDSHLHLHQSIYSFLIAKQQQTLIVYTSVDAKQKSFILFQRLSIRPREELIRAQKVFIFIFIFGRKKQTNRTTTRREQNKMLKL
jgi:hypothetical protein